MNEIMLFYLYYDHKRREERKHVAEKPNGRTYCP